MPFLGKILWKNPSPAGRYSCEICHWWVNFFSRSMTFHPWSKSRVNSRVSTFMDWPWLSVMRAWHPPSRYLGGRSATFSNHKFLCYLTSFELPQLLTGMEKLQHLDISDERDAQHPLDNIATIPNRCERSLPCHENKDLLLIFNHIYIYRKISATEFLVQAKDRLPNLMSLDLSGMLTT